MGEFICVCAIEMCEIKPVEVSVCNTGMTGWGSPSPTYCKQCSKRDAGKQSQMADFGRREEAGGDGVRWQDGGGLFGANPALWPMAPLHLHTGDGPGASSKVAIYFCMLIFYFTHPVQCILTHVLPAWSRTFERHEMTKHSFVFQPGSLRVCSSGVCLGFQLHHHI